MTQHRSVVVSIPPEIEIHSKRLHRHPASPEPKAKRAKKKLKVAPSMVSLPPAIVSQAVELPTLTPSVPAPKDKRKVLADPQVCRSPRFET